MVQKERRLSQEDQAAQDMLNKLHDIETHNLRFQLAQIEAGFKELYTDAERYQELLHAIRNFYSIQMNDKAELAGISEKYHGNDRTEVRSPSGRLFDLTRSTLESLRNRERNSK